jgi:hypothetical protein
MVVKFFKYLTDSLAEWLIHEHPYKGIPLCDFEQIRYELRPCDVILIEGRSRVSEIIQSITQSSWSHAALYIGRLHDIEDPKIRNLISTHFNGTPDTQLIIEGIMGKGTIITDLVSYEKDHIRICRPKGISRQDAQHVIAYGIHQLGYEYDLRHVIDLARFLLPWTLFPRRFRSKLFQYYPGESTRTVCSTMIAEAFNSVEFPILPLIKQHATKGIEFITRNPKLYSPRDFDYSPYFEIIKYPFVEFADYAMYRRLPWNREGLVSHDREGVNPVHFSKKPSIKIHANIPRPPITPINLSKVASNLPKKDKTSINPPKISSKPITVPKDSPTPTAIAEPPPPSINLPKTPPTPSSPTP